MIWSTYFGGDGNDKFFTFSKSENNKYIYVVRTTTSLTDFPLRNPQNGGFFQDNLKGIDDGFIGRLNIENIIVSQREPLTKESLELLVFPNPTLGL